MGGRAVTMGNSWLAATVDERASEAKTSLSAHGPRAHGPGGHPGVERDRCRQHNSTFIYSFSSSALCLSFSGQN